MGEAAKAALVPMDVLVVFFVSLFFVDVTVRVCVADANQLECFQ